MGRFIIESGASLEAEHKGLVIMGVSNASTTIAIAGPVINIPATRRQDLTEQQLQWVTVPANHRVSAGNGRIYCKN